ncbi:hypothetical protein [Dermacoccus sp. PAMC28757]|uniref:hypothetical protein n=1 Tax=Dermacoccus sp. PAMC28757 TaxID=2762331 RepID=UPI001C9B807D|nr:hypothetical protein [Dermacoccus sp. PAMC28757]
MRPTLHRSLVALTALGAFSLTTACTKDEPRPLPAGDQSVCNAAHANNARTVYNVRHQPTDAELKKQANRIYPGSSDTNDTDAIKQIKTRCKNLGYESRA